MTPVQASLKKPKKKYSKKIKTKERNKNHNLIWEIWLEQLILRKCSQEVTVESGLVNYTH